MAQPNNRSWLRYQAYAVVFCLLFTFFIGLAVWFETLKTGLSYPSCS